MEALVLGVTVARQRCPPADLASRDHDGDGTRVALQQAHRLLVDVGNDLLVAALCELDAAGANALDEHRAERVRRHRRLAAALPAPAKPQQMPRFPSLHDRDSFSPRPGAAGKHLGKQKRG